MTKKLGNWKQPLIFWKNPISYIRNSYKNLWLILKQYLKRLPQLSYFRWLIWIPATVGALVFILVLTFTFDALVFSSSNSAPRNLKLIINTSNVSINVGGLNKAEIKNLLLSIDEDQTKIQIVFPTNTSSVDLTPAELGILIDVENTTDAILKNRRNKGFFSHLISWGKSFFSSDKVKVQYIVERQNNDFFDNPSLPELPILLTQAESANFKQVAPSKPLVLVPNVIGKQINAESFYNTAQLVIDSNFPSRVGIIPAPAYPQVQNHQMDAAIKIANARTAVGLDVLLKGEVRRMSIESYRSVFKYELESESQLLTTQLVANSLQRNIEILFSDFVDDSTKPIFRISKDNVPRYTVEGTNFGCCALVTSKQIEELLAGKTLLEVSTKELSQNVRVDFDNLLIREVIGEYSLSFSESDPRATNIRIAGKAISGTVILPGDSWSVNSHLGPRTLRKGYISAPFPFQSGYSDIVGGGVEVVATGLFNAALLGGLDIPLRHPHPVWDENYPYGRDALLNWPNPGLILSNPTPFGVLIWSEFSEGKITIRLYSSRYYERVIVVDAVDPVTTTSVGNCRRVRIIRERRGGKEDRDRLIDIYYSFYYPDFAVNCDLTNNLPNLNIPENDTSENETTDTEESEEE